MASEWANAQVEKIIKLSECIHEDDCEEPYGADPCNCWVSEVRQEIADALDEAERRGAREERAACYRIADDNGGESGCGYAEDISARGPMIGPEGGVVDWADNKALALLAESFVEHTEECQHALWNEPGCTCGHEELRDSFAAALREAWEQGREEAAATINEFVLSSKEAFERGREQGSREERRECWSLVKEMSLPDAYSEPALDALAAEIAARGPMSQEGGGE